MVIKEDKCVKCGDAEYITIDINYEAPGCFAEITLQCPLCGHTKKEKINQ